MIEIPLTQGKVALISDHRYELVSQYKWNAHKKGNTWYATTTIPSLGERWYTRPNGRRERMRKVLPMHQLITGLKDVDHADRNGLNCQDENLRPANRSQQVANTARRSDNITGFKGVSFDGRTARWRTLVYKNGRQVYSKYFDDPIVAAFAYDAKAYEMFGEFACPNFTFTPDNTMPRVWEEPVTT